MLIIRQSEATAARRVIPFMPLPAISALSLTIANVRVSKNGVSPSAGAGTLQNLGESGLSDGAYSYQATAGECDTLGTLIVVLNDGSGSMVAMGAAQVVPYDPYDPSRGIPMRTSALLVEPAAAAERYLAECSAQAAFALAAGRFAASAYQTGGALNDQATVRPVPCRHARGLKVTFFGTGANDSTFQYRLWLSRRSRADPAQPGVLGGGGLTLYCSGTATLSNLVGEAAAESAAGVRSTERLADTVTQTIHGAASTPKGGGALVGKGSTDASGLTYSPGSDADAAAIIIPDLADATEVVLEFALGSATGANAMVEAIR